MLAAYGLRGFGSQALEHTLSQGGTRAEQLHSMGDLPGSRIEAMSPALGGGGFFTIKPTGMASR